MSTILRSASAFVVTVTIVLCLQGVASAQNRDSREVMSYALTEAGLAKFTQATKNLASVPGVCARANDDDDDSNSQTIDQMAAKINAVPGAQAAIQSAGMPTREYIVFMWSMMQNGMAAWALTQPGGKLPPGISQSNVDFYKRHEAEMTALGDQPGCEDESREDEEDGEAG